MRPLRVPNFKIKKNFCFQSNIYNNNNIKFLRNHSEGVTRGANREVNREVNRVANRGMLFLLFPFPDVISVQHLIFHSLPNSITKNILGEEKIFDFIVFDLTLNSAATHQRVLQYVNLAPTQIHKDIVSNHERFVNYEPMDHVHGMLDNTYFELFGAFFF